MPGSVDLQDQQRAAEEDVIRAVPSMIHETMSEKVFTYESGLGAGPSIQAAMPTASAGVNAKTSVPSPLPALPDSNAVPLVPTNGDACLLPAV